MKWLLNYQTTGPRGNIKMECEDRNITTFVVIYICRPINATSLVSERRKGMRKKVRTEKRE